jgi:hypothetical protein
VRSSANRGSIEYPHLHAALATPAEAMRTFVMPHVGSK